MWLKYPFIESEFENIEPVIEKIDENLLTETHTNGQVVNKTAGNKEWKNLQRLLVKNKPLTKLSKLFGATKRSPMLWGMSAIHVGDAAQEEIQLWHTAFFGDRKKKKTAQAILGFIANVDSKDLDCAAALKLVAAVHFMPRVAEYSDQVSWVTATLAAIKMAKEQDINFEQQPLLYQLISVELPLTIALQLESVCKTKKLAKRSAKNFKLLVAEILDGDGWPAAEHISSFFPLVASWSRSVAIIRHLKMKLPTNVALQLEWAVRQSIRLSRPNGTLMGSGKSANPFNTDFLQTMLRMSPDSLDRKVANTAIKVSRANANSKTRNPSSNLPESSSQSEWAAIGVLRSGWHRNASRLAFTYRRRQNWLELGRAKGLVMGDCTPRLLFDGTPLGKEDDVDNVCESFDDEIDYIELDFSFAKGVNLQRQIIFGKQDEFVIIADSIVSPVPGSIEYHCEFPLVEGISVTEETETRELYLRDTKIRSLVLPISLPEWKIARTDDRFSHEEGRLILQQSHNGTGMCAALFFDLKPSRSVKPRTWRQLTVAESLRIVDKDVAVANRIQVGKDQWVVYRSIGPSENRTFFGQNFNEQTFVGKLDSKGAVRELLLVE